MFNYTDLYFRSDGSFKLKEKFLSTEFTKTL